jgi:hypothetical protein
MFFVCMIVLALLIAALAVAFAQHIGEEENVVEQKPR